MHADRFTSRAVIGEKVTGISEGPGYRTEWSGIYEGVRPSEHTGEPVHFFRDGIMGETPQGCFALPVEKFHGFDNLEQSIPEACVCGAMFVEGFHLDVMKRAHLDAMGV